jgi:hypothetical protein
MIALQPLTSRSDDLVPLISRFGRLTQTSFTNPVRWYALMNFVELFTRKAMKAGEAEAHRRLLYIAVILSLVARERVVPLPEEIYQFLSAQQYDFSFETFMVACESVFDIIERIPPAALSDEEQKALNSPPLQGRAAE